MARWNRVIRRLMCLAALLPVAAAIGQPPAAATGTLSLSDDQKAALLARDTEDSVATARSGLGTGGRPMRQIHGEIGAFVGTNGARGAYGAAAIPLGDDAQAAVSFETSRYGRPR